MLGFKFIPNPFRTVHEQEQWVRRSLRAYLHASNRTNVSERGLATVDTWRNHVRSSCRRCRQSKATLPGASDSARASDARSTVSGLDSTTAIVPAATGAGVGAVAGAGAGAGAAGDAGEAVRGGKQAALQEVTWVTLGCHYDWTRRAYHSARGWVSPFPPALGGLATSLAQSVGAPRGSPCWVRRRCGVTGC